MHIKNDLVVLDLETTGTWVDKDKIIEIAMIKRRIDGSEATFDRRVNPGIPIPASVSAITGIKDEDVRDAPSFDKIAAEVLEFIKGCDLGGFNILRFDLPLLKREIAEAGLRFPWEGVRAYDAQTVYHLNEKRDLTAAYDFYCGKNLENAHSAMADSQATLEILAAQVARYGQAEQGLPSLEQFEYRQTADYLDGGRKFRWWNGKPYMMFGKYARKYSLQEVARMDPGYLEWILSAKFSDEVKDLVSEALRGHFPVQENREQKPH